MLTWIRGYQRAWLRGDVLAGVTVTAYLVPQVMANAELAGVPAVAGLWAAIGALLGYALLGTGRLLSLGPESTAALMTATSLAAVPADERPAFAAALAVATAGWCLVAWLGRLSALADLLSKPVLVGYLTGIALIMIQSQLGDVLGIDVEGDGFFPEVWYAVTHLGDAHGPTVVLGLSVLVAMLLAAWRWPKAPVALLGMLGATAAVALLDLRDRGVEVVGEIPAGLPPVSVPHIPLDDLRQLLPAALGVAFVTFTDTILTGRAFAEGHVQPDPRRELLALGAANLGAGLLHGLPSSSSGSRTAIAAAVGGRSQLAGVATLVGTIAAVLLARPVLEQFPTAALGAVVVYAAVRLVDARELIRFGRFRTSELVLALGTTGAVLVTGVLEGILVAILLSVADLLRRVARPHDAVLGFVPGIAGMHDVDDYPLAAPVPGLVVYRWDSPLFFANAENFRTRALAAYDEASSRPGGVRWFVLNCEAIVEIDVTGSDALEDLRRELTDRGVVVGLARVKQELLGQLATTGLPERIGAELVFPTLPTAVAAYRVATGG
ncbi:SulP family inorganic anion transporter [Nocardioides sp. CER19]|uniref:SulP family inorganic anion transporter n=1 Tax=Nocardioides sp. CER19 TaxID=3038538 RepID=UPI00244B6B6F|nr:SulP family inorganic anion transporter [Nocardioides sp. CER19]MDH2415696.1 SulP family inorganic anion transporter [Nocardioides sp. CER19]